MQEAVSRARLLPERSNSLRRERERERKGGEAEWSGGEVIHGTRRGSENEYRRPHSFIPARERT